jgi:hypothetical protein
MCPRPCCLQDVEVTLQTISIHLPVGLVSSLGHTAVDPAFLGRTSQRCIRWAVMARLTMGLIHGDSNLNPLAEGPLPGFSFPK